jgi:Rod binding domain-containing protein
LCKDKPIVPADLSAVSVLKPISTTTGAGAGPIAPRHQQADAPREFEAIFLQNAIQSMLPKEAEGVFGKGLAGDIWRSMLAEKLAFQLAERGDFGMADLIRAGMKARVASEPAPAGQVQQAGPVPRS